MVQCIYIYNDDYFICLPFQWLQVFVLCYDYHMHFTAERRRQSYQLESLFEYYVGMLCENHAEWELAKVWEAIRKGLQIYPSNPNLYSALTEISKLHTSPNKLQWIFDDYCHK